MKKTGIMLLALMVISCIALHAQHGTEKKGISQPSDAQGKAFLAAGIVVGLGSIAAGAAVGITGSAAIGALAEKPELMGKLIIIIGLAEGIAIYGLIMGIMIIGKV